MPYNDDDVKTVVVSKATTAIQAMVPHPGVGKRLAIDYVALNSSGGANVVTITGTVAAIFSLPTLTNLILDNANHDPKGVFHCNPDQAFSLTLGSATAVTGYIKYRIING